jgi:hypothetical protein
MAAMDRETFTESIRAFKHRAPFQPFTVVTVNGNRYEVDHPEALALRDGLAPFFLLPSRESRRTLPRLGRLRAAGQAHACDVRASARWAVAGFNLAHA